MDEKTHKSHTAVTTRKQEAINATRSSIDDTNLSQEEVAGISSAGIPSDDEEVVSSKKSLTGIHGSLTIGYFEEDELDSQAFELVASEFSGQNPGVNVERTPVSHKLDAPSDNRFNLHEAISYGQAPDVFQAEWGSATVERYVRDGKLVPLDHIAQSSGLLASCPEQFLSTGKLMGSIWGLPVSIGRSNLMWFNQQFFHDTGINSPPYWSNWEEAFVAMTEIKNLGVVPFAVANTHSGHCAHLFENILLSELGPLPYTKLFSGEVSWLDPGVTKCLNILKKLLIDFSDAGYSQDGRYGALDAVLSKRSATTIFSDQGLKFIYGKGTDTGVSFCPSPGTQGVFSFMGDAFYMSRSVKSSEATNAWLTMISNRYHQDQYNQMRVSLPPRIDADQSMYTEDQGVMLRDWKRDYIVPSVVFGTAAGFSWRSNFVSALQFFSLRLDVEPLQRYLSDQCSFGIDCH